MNSEQHRTISIYAAITLLVFAAATASRAAASKPVEPLRLPVEIVVRGPAPEPQLYAVRVAMIDAINAHPGLAYQDGDEDPVRLTLDFDCFGTTAGLTTAQGALQSGCKVRLSLSRALTAAGARTGSDDDQGPRIVYWEGGSWAYLNYRPSGFDLANESGRREAVTHQRWRLESQWDAVATVAFKFVRQLDSAHLERLSRNR